MKRYLEKSDEDERVRERERERLSLLVFVKYRRTGRQADKQSVRQTDRQRSKQTDRQTDKQTDKQTEPGKMQKPQTSHQHIYYWHTYFGIVSSQSLFTTHMA